ncbi:MAG: hypothetical protein GXP58_07505 [Deltaproteobacteria bacterium]|nr:hypothetical protein [Deltaproteobacteria bacterium]
MKKFVFVVHPRNYEDVVRVFPFFRYLPEKAVVRGIRLTRPFPRLWLCSSFDVLGKVRGHILAAPLTAEQMLTRNLREVRRVILHTVLYAQEKLRAEVIGLGALTASVTNGGKWLAKRSEVRAAVTHGDTFAVAVAMEGIGAILRKKRGAVAVTGATGIIGSALARLLAKKDRPLILLGRNRRKLKSLAAGLNGVRNLTISTDLAVCRGAEIVVAATSHSDTILKGEHLRKGAVIYDVCQPEAVSLVLLRKRPDLVRIDGSLAAIPGVDPGFAMGPPKGTTFACLAETMLHALEGKREDRVGPIDATHIDNLRTAGKKYGFVHAPFTCFGRPLNGKLH